MAPNEASALAGAVLGFDGPHRFLSNFWTGPEITWNGVTAPSAEHHYNAAKTLDALEAAEVYRQETPGRAKRAGRKVTLREDWDEVKVGCMKGVLEEKFSDPGLRTRLLDTGDDLLVESNTWHDQFWGDCTCPQHLPWPGRNTLGLLLMDLRSRLRDDPTDRAVRVALTGHRPKDLFLDQQTWVRSTLPKVLATLVANHGTRVAISGMALGADTCWAETALDAGVALWAYVPFEAQADDWASEDRAHWTALRSQAAREVVLGTSYDVRRLRARNEFMVRDADLVIAVHHPDKTTGGTASTIRRARAANKPMVRLNVATQEVTHGA